MSNPTITTRTYRGIGGADVTEYRGPNGAVKLSHSRVTGLSLVEYLVDGLPFSTLGTFTDRAEAIAAATEAVA